MQFLISVVVFTSLIVSADGSGANAAECVVLQQKAEALKRSLEVKEDSLSEIEQRAKELIELESQYEDRIADSEDRMKDSYQRLYSMKAELQSKKDQLSELKTHVEDAKATKNRLTKDSQTQNEALAHVENYVEDLRNSLRKAKESQHKAAVDKENLDVQLDSERKQVDEETSVVEGKRDNRDVAKQKRDKYYDRLAMLSKNADAAALREADAEHYVSIAKDKHAAFEEELRVSRLKAETEQSNIAALKGRMDHGQVTLAHRSERIAAESLEKAIKDAEKSLLKHASLITKQKQLKADIYRLSASSSDQTTDKQIQDDLQTEHMIEEANELLATSFLQSSVDDQVSLLKLRGAALTIGAEIDDSRNELIGLKYPIEQCLHKYLLSKNATHQAEADAANLGSILENLSKEYSLHSMHLVDLEEQTRNATTAVQELSNELQSERGSSRSATESATMAHADFQAANKSFEAAENAFQSAQVALISDRADLQKLLASAESNKWDLANTTSIAIIVEKYYSEGHAQYEQLVAEHQKLKDAVEEASNTLTAKMAEFKVAANAFKESSESLKVMKKAIGSQEQRVGSSAEKVSEYQNERLELQGQLRMGKYEITSMKVEMQNLRDQLNSKLCGQYLNYE